MTAAPDSPTPNARRGAEAHGPAAKEIARGRRRILPIGALAISLLAASCSGDDLLAARTEPAAITEASTPAATPPTCPDPDADATRSYAPSAGAGDPSTVQNIRARGRLIVGVSGDTLRFGARNPIKGVIEGFDIDILKEVANAIFGDSDPGRIEYRVITYAQRLPSLQDGTVDLVAHTMTINCVRWQQIAFSSTYFVSGQRVLVRRGSTDDTIDKLNAAGARVCAPAGSTNVENLAPFTNIQQVVVPDITDCLVRFQQGTADAITGDDTVLAGFAAQDPYGVVNGDAFSSEPYGIGVRSGDVDFVRYVNRVLEQVRSSGRWQEIWNTWLSSLGAAPEPPAPVYGRTGP